MEGEILLGSMSRTITLEELLEETLMKNDTTKRRVLTVGRGIQTTRSAGEIWKWLAFLLSKFNRFMKYISCDGKTFGDAFHPVPILKRAEQQRRSQMTTIDGEDNADVKKLPPDVITEQLCPLAMPRKARHRGRGWIRRLTIRVNKKGVQKRRAEFDSEARSSRWTRKRRRLARGWVRQRSEASDIVLGEPRAKAPRTATCNSLPGRSYFHAEVVCPSSDFSAGSTERDVNGISATFSVLNNSSRYTAARNNVVDSYWVQSRGRHKSSPFDERIVRLLPDELMDKVLPWLPLTSVLRFRSVCKRWQSLLCVEGWPRICERPPAWNACPALFSSGGSRRQCAFYDHSLEKWSRMLLDFLPRTACCLLAASGGLICLCFSGMNSSLYVCNPLTKSWKELPPFNHKRRRAGSMLVHLLVDSKSKAYKVIVIGHPTCLGSASPTMTEVYDSESGKWTPLANVPSGGCILAPSIAFRNGILYCLTESPTGILAFNIVRKVWRRLEIKSHSRVLCILEHNGQILIVAKMIARVTRLGIWKLRESFPRMWFKVALMPVDHALYFVKSGKFQCFAHGNLICFASPRRPQWLSFDIKHRVWRWGVPARGVNPDSYNKWFFYEPRLDISA